MRHFLTIAILLISISLGAQETVEKTIVLDPYLSFQNYEHFKRLTLSSPNSEIEYLKGFQFEWGYAYEVLVLETKISSDLSDGTMFEYAFDYIISMEKVADSTHFPLFLDANRYYYPLDSSEQHLNATLSQLNDSTYRYFDKVDIEVPIALRDSFGLIVAGKTERLGIFLFVDEKRIRLVGFGS